LASVKKGKHTKLKVNTPQAGGGTARYGGEENCLSKSSKLGEMEPPAGTQRGKKNRPFRGGEGRYYVK